MIIPCYHNDCLERFDLLFFKEIFYSIPRELPRGEGRALSCERLRAETSPSFIFLVYLLCRLMTPKD